MFKIQINFNAEITRNSCDGRKEYDGLIVKNCKQIDERGVSSNPSGVRVFHDVSQHLLPVPWRKPASCPLSTLLIVINGSVSVVC